ncbi:MAG: SMP-30/gluconolactonase/LRE family protein [Tetrasphaera sp.]
MQQRNLTVIPVPGVGAEDVLVAEDGTVYTGCADGYVYALGAGGDEVWRVGGTGGRPLGLEWLPDGRLLVCDAHRGLVAMDTHDGRVDVLARTVAGVPMVFTNNAAVLSDGTIWFTDSSTRWSIERWKADLIEDTCTGRLLRLDPGSTEPDVVLDGLSFANGVAKAPDGSFVVVAETGHRRLRRHYLSGRLAGNADVFAEDLPSHPDNIALGSDGLIWVTYTSPSDPILGVLQHFPALLRGLVRRAPEWLQPAPQRVARVAAYDLNGQVVHDIDCDARRWQMATGVREHDGRVWLGSLVEPAVAWFDL